jgi:RecA-family ATPase
MRPAGTKDNQVAVFRHLLVEFDQGLSPEQQFAVYLQANLPTTAIIFSGGKSVHAWVRVEARDHHEFAARAALIYEHLKAAGLPVDMANRNPGRLSRLPNALRLQRTQELLCLNVGAVSFDAWLRDAQADGIGTVINVGRLLEFKPAEDPNNLFGQRWLCRGGSALLVGPSGVGKSSLVLQLAVGWAVGLPVFGIEPVRPLRTLLMQAEDDEGDLAEMFQGITTGLALTAEQLDQMKDRLVIIRDAVHTGQQFAAAIQVLIERHRPDLVVFNPLLSFIGEDVTRQEVCSQFLRSWLGPIAEATGVAWLAVHHTGKPPANQKTSKSWSSDWGYTGLGSSELTNWARAIMVLRHVDPGSFHLMLAKRGKRAKATHPDGTPTNVIWLQHAPDRIFWRQVQPDAEPVGEDGQDASTSSTRKGGRPSSLDSLLKRDLSALLDAISSDGETRNQIGERLRKYGDKVGIEIGKTTARTKGVSRLTEPLRKLRYDEHKDRYFKA